MASRSIFIPHPDRLGAGKKIVLRFCFLGCILGLGLGADVTGQSVYLSLCLRHLKRLKSAFADKIVMSAWISPSFSSRSIGILTPSKLSSSFVFSDLLGMVLLGFISSDL